MMEEGKLLPTATIIEPIPPPNDCDQKHPMLGSVRERDEARDTEDILFDSRKSSFCNGAAGEANLTQKIMDKNLKLINIILILFGVLSILFIVYEAYQLMDQLHADNVAGPTLGFLISVYAVTSGSAFFAIQTSSVQNRAARTRVISNKIIFCGINILFGASMVLCMALIGSGNKWPLANIAGLMLGSVLVAIGIFPFLTNITNCRHRQQHYNEMWRSEY